MQPRPASSTVPRGRRAAGAFSLRMSSRTTCEPVQEPRPDGKQNFVRDVLAVERVPRVDDVAGLRVHAAPEAEPDLRPTELGETKTVPADFCSAGMLAPSS